MKDLRGTKVDGSLAIRTMHNGLFHSVALTASEEGIIRLELFETQEMDGVVLQPGTAGAAKIADQAIDELEQYFNGNLCFFTVPINLEGVTDFQRRVLRHVAQIPLGAVETYGEVALYIGKPNSARAVGGALARNPIAIRIPCHRVVAHCGHLNGFSAVGGIGTKEKLLLHEGVRVIDKRVVMVDRWKA